jgi:hypothetical protein
MKNNQQKKQQARISVFITFPVISVGQCHATFSDMERPVQQWIKREKLRISL